MGEGEGKLSEESFPSPSQNPIPSLSKTFGLTQSLLSAFPVGAFNGLYPTSSYEGLLNKIVQQPFCFQEKTPRPVPWQNGNAANRDSIQSKSLGGREEGSLPRFHIHTLLFLSPLHTLNVFNFLLLGLFGELAEDEHIDAAAFGRLKGKFGTREGAVPARITERTKT